MDGGRLAVIGIVGEAGLGTRAYSKDNWLGLSSYIRDLKKQGEKIDAFVVNGGLIPEVNPRANEASLHKHRFLDPAIEGLEDIEFIAGPVVRRLVDACGEETQFYYQKSGQFDEDGNNEKQMRQDLTAELHSKEKIKATIGTLESKIETYTAKINEMRVSYDALAKVIEGKEAALKALTSNEPDYAQQKRWLERELANVYRHGKTTSKKFDKLRQELRRCEKDKGEMEQELEQLRMRHFTHTQRLSLAEAAGIEASAKTEYNALIKRTFGLEDDRLAVLENTVNRFHVGGVAIDSTHKGNNTSSVAKKAGIPYEIGRYKRDLVQGTNRGRVGISTHHAGGTVIKPLPRERGGTEPYFLLQQGAFFDPERLKACWREGIKLPQTEAAGKYQYDSGATIIYLEKDGSVTFELIGHSELKHRADVRRAQELEELYSRLGNLSGVKFDGLQLKFTHRNRNSKKYALTLDAVRKQYLENSRDLDINEQTRVSTYQKLLSKFPSELDDEDLSKLIIYSWERIAGDSDVVDKSDVAKFFDLTPSGKNTDDAVSNKVVVDYVGDIHMGVPASYGERSSYELAEAWVKDSKGRGMPDVLVLGGDIVEGSLKGKLNDAIAMTSSQLTEIMQKVQGMGMSAEDSRAVFDELVRRQVYATALTNVNDQVLSAAPIVKYAAEIMANGGEVVLISGNHYNKTSEDEKFDEAKELRNAIMYASGAGPAERRIHVYSGGWQGSGCDNVKGIKIFGIHQARKDAMLKSGQDADTFAYFHTHDPEVRKTYNHLELTGVGMSPKIPFVDQAALFHGLKGYGRVEFELDAANHVRDHYRVTYVFEPQLEAHMQPIPEKYKQVVLDLKLPKV